MNRRQAPKVQKKPAPDYVGSLVLVMVVASWFVALAIIWTLSEAAPETAWGMDNFYGVSRSRRWSKELLSLAQNLTLALMMVTLLGLGIQNSQGDVGLGELNKSLVAFAGLSIAGLVAFFFAA